MVDEGPVVRTSSLRIGHAGRALLPPIDVEIRPGEFWVVIGRNGSGKTTWMRTVLGLLPPVGGKVERASRHLRQSYAPQRAALDELYPALARDVVALGLDRGWSFLKPRPRDWRKRVLEALREMGVEDFADSPFRALSEGQKQRVLFARVVISDSQLALLDEPTSAMDAVAERQALELLDALRKRHGTAIVIVSHHFGPARDFADRVLLLDRDTPAVVYGTPEEVFSHAAFRERYGRVSGEMHA
jgi:zinc transport system ATP-binding protein